MESTRQKKVSRLLQKELAEILRQKTTELARGKMITVTTVRVSPDLGLAKIYLSIFPSDKNEETLEKITDNTPRIRNELGSKVRKQLRIIPEIAFYLDDSLDYIDNIDSILNKD
ncbi:MAG: 30S ribosome-binding factor RbfA [Bacteroidales bacterium]|jgi:ribosome-binding factor A|nr:30S ribosome-binding factor RbfA [Bacteroidales bacterium]